MGFSQKLKFFCRKSKKGIDFCMRMTYNSNVRRINACGGANLEKRTTKVKKPEILLSKELLKRK